MVAMEQPHRRTAAAAVGDQVRLEESNLGQWRAPVALAHLAQSLDQQSPMQAGAGDVRHLAGRIPGAQEAQVVAAQVATLELLGLLAP